MGNNTSLKSCSEYLSVTECREYIKRLEQAIQYLSNCTQRVEHPDEELEFKLLSIERIYKHVQQVYSQSKVKLENSANNTIGLPTQINESIDYREIGLDYGTHPKKVETKYELYIDCDKLLANKTCYLFSPIDEIGLSENPPVEPIYASLVVIPEKFNNHMDVFKRLLVPEYAVPDEYIGLCLPKTVTDERLENYEVLQFKRFYPYIFKVLGIYRGIHATYYWNKDCVEEVDEANGEILLLVEDIFRKKMLKVFLDPTSYINHDKLLRGEIVDIAFFYIRRINND